MTKSASRGLVYLLFVSGILGIGVQSFGAGVGTVTAQAAPLKIMALGDSNTEGYPDLKGGYRPQFWSRMTADGFTVQMVGSLTDSFVWAQPQHEGHSGWTISQIDAQVTPWMQTYQPDIVLLMLGTNDVLFGEGDTDLMVSRMGALIDHLIAAKPDVQIIVAQLLPLNNPNPILNAQIKAFNAALPNIVYARATLGYRVSVVDMYTPFTFADLVDGIHPTEAAYIRMGDVWYVGVSAALRNPFQPLTPVAHQTLNTPVFQFAWTQGTPDETYKLKIKSSDNTYVVTIPDIPASMCANSLCRWTADLSLHPPPSQTTLRWRVIGNGRRTSWQSFYTDLPGAVALLNPFEGKVVDTFTPKFNWRYNPYATDYVLRVDWLIAPGQKQRVIDLQFNATSTPTAAEICDLIAQRCQANLQTLGLSLPADGAYQWRVQSLNQYGKSKSAKVTFTVNTTPATLIGELIPLPDPLP